MSHLLKLCVLSALHKNRCVVLVSLGGGGVHSYHSFQAALFLPLPSGPFTQFHPPCLPLSLPSWLLNWGTFLTSECFNPGLSCTTEIYFLVVYFLSCDLLFPVIQSGKRKRWGQKLGFVSALGLTEVAVTELECLQWTHFTFMPVWMLPLTNLKS